MRFQKRNLILALALKRCLFVNSVARGFARFIGDANRQSDHLFAPTPARRAAAVLAMRLSKPITENKGEISTIQPTAHCGLQVYHSLGSSTSQMQTGTFSLHQCQSDGNIVMALNP